MIIYIIIAILIAHWFADFVFQRDIDAVNKSKSIKHLSYHVLMYSGVMTVMLLPIIISNPLFLLNFPAHFIIDYITSKINSKLWEEGKRHEFFTMIGFDQLLHYICLSLTLYF